MAAQYKTTAALTNVRTWPSTAYPFAPGYPNGMLAGTTLLCRGYYTSNSSVGGNNRWIQTQANGYFMHSSGFVGGVSGLTYYGHINT